VERPTVLRTRATGPRWRAGLVSLIAAVALLALKFYAWHLTGSVAVLSDAMESIVNVVAAVFLLGGLLFAGIPADRNHPYGHGKIEYFTATFEGGLIVAAGVLILYEAWTGFVQRETPAELDAGMLLVAGAGAANLVLGLYLVRVGRRHDSAALVADGRHVISDWWTTVGVIGGLLAVKATGIWWFDPAIAGLVALQLLWTGIKLVRHSSGALLDEEDPALLARLVAMLQEEVGGGVISVHQLRAIRAGRFHHISAHLVVPEFWSVLQAHDLSESLAARIIRRMGIEGELVFHTDPCHRAHCAHCDYEPCPVRMHAFEQAPQLTVDGAVQPDRHAEQPAAQH
jgi:cation diffusion facilitator family transporter